jgi:hypothetical protein
MHLFLSRPLNLQVMELSENLKLRLDVPTGESQQDKLSRMPDQNASGDAGQSAEAESQMRRALGLLGESPRHRPDAERMEQTGRSSGGFGGGLHRRRFVQDGDIPVTVLRREPGHDASQHRVVAPVSAPTSSRLQRTEAALAAETTAREKAERSLNEAYAVIRDLQTKIGHAELAKNEAVEALHRERDLASQLRGEAEEWEARLQDARDQIHAAQTAASGYQDQLAEERQARKAAEKALCSAEAARDAAEEQLVNTLSEEASKRSRGAVPRSAQQSAEPLQPEPNRAERKRAEPIRRARVAAEPEVLEAAPRRSRAVEVAPEPEPVKWWLNTKPAPKRR